MNATETQSVKMFSDEAWSAGYAEAERRGLTTTWLPAARPVTRHDVEAIVSAVANHGFTELCVDQLMADAQLDAARDDMMESLRKHMRDHIAMEAIRANCVMLTLPREVIDHPERGLTRIRLIVPVRDLSTQAQP